MVYAPSYMIDRFVGRWVVSDEFVDTDSVIFESVYDLLHVCISKKTNSGICTVRL